jgi:hypothetical protein
MPIGIDRHANLAVVPIAQQKGAAPVVTGPVVTELAVATVIVATVIVATVIVATVIVAQLVADMVEIALGGIVAKETDLHDDRVLLAQKVLAIANDQREVDHRQVLADTAEGPQETVLQV